MSKSTPSFVKPFLYALNRMQENESLRPNQYLERSRVLMVDRLGVEGHVPEAAFAHGSVGLIADHTHYFSGFALMLQMRQGIAVSIRPSSSALSRLVVEGNPETFEFDCHEPSDAPLEALVTAVLSDLTKESWQVDLSLVAAIPPGLGMAYHAAFTIALIRAVEAYTGLESTPAEVRVRARNILDRVAGMPVSPAYAIGASLSEEGPFVLIDTLNGEFLRLDAPAGQRPGFVLLDTGGANQFPPKGMAERKEATRRATEALQGTDFPRLSTLRDLEHRDLDEALEAIPSKLRHAVRFLVSSNRNVQKLTVAIRRQDWQFFGAILKIMQASQVNDWATTRPVFTEPVAEAERLSLDGIYGVVQTGEQGMLLVVGQPFSLPSYLDNLRESQTKGIHDALIL